MPITLNSRADLTLANYRAVVLAKERLLLTDHLLGTVTAVRAAFLRYMERQEGAVYGVTSGYGYNARKKMDADEAAAFHRRSLAVGAMSFGDPLPAQVVRGILFARLANLIEGHGATTVRVVSYIVGMLNGEHAIPPVPGDGNGAAGEILPLYHLFAPLTDAFPMEIKEKGPLTNGAPCAAALLSDVALFARPRWELAASIFALSAEAMRTPLGAFDPVLATLWNDPDAGAALTRLSALLQGGASERRSFQAPVSFRILPRVLGRAHRSLRTAEETASAILPAVTDNPVYLPPSPGHPDGQSFSTGGYHDSHAVPAIDALTREWADLALIAERHATKLLDGAVSGLPEKLSRGGTAGGTIALAYAPMASVGFLETARGAATMTLLPGAEGGAFGQDDVVSPVFQAWHKHGRAALAFERALAVVAAVASQALWVTDREAPPALAPLLEQIRADVPPVDDVAHRTLGHDCGRLAEAFRARLHASLTAP